LSVQAVQEEASGPCRDINYDPTVLPEGIHTSAVPFPAVSSSAYALSYQLRAAEDLQYPRTTPGARP
jgi:catalase